jgi:hypothetical protein
VRGDKSKPTKLCRTEDMESGGDSVDMLEKLRLVPTFGFLETDQLGGVRASLVPLYWEVSSVADHCPSS